MILGIDFGNTVVFKRNGVFIAYPFALKTIKEFVNQGIAIHIISKVNDIQKKEVENWIREENFFEETGIPETHLHFCERRDQKGPIAVNLGITHHIDDRPEVMAHMPENVFKYLFNPVPLDVVKYFNDLQNTMVVSNWFQVRDEIFTEYVQNTLL